MNVQKSLMNGIGAAEMTHMIAIPIATIRDFLALKPPRALVTLPPITTPSTGPVILTIPKVICT